MQIFENEGTRTFWKMRDLLHLHRHLIHGIIAMHGLHQGQPRILHTIASQPGASQRVIAATLHISAASLAVSVKRMEKAGLLRKQEADGDLRRNILTLTEKGEAVLNACFSDFVATDSGMFKGFSDEEMTQLNLFFSRIETNLNESANLQDGHDPLHLNAHDNASDNQEGQA